MALIPPWHADCVVALGVDNAAGERLWIATGFLYGRLKGTGSDGRTYHYTYLVTNRHVLKDPSRIYLRFNPQADEAAREYPVDLNSGGAQAWIGHPRPEIDVGVIPVNFDPLKSEAMQVSYFADKHAAPIDVMKSLGVTEGDFAYVLGFPMGLIGGRRSTVIVRGGSIARLRDLLSKSSDSFLVDAAIFPGNSGGPVVLRPEVGAVAGTKAVGRAMLIGLVEGYVPYHDVAISQQTGAARVVFTENSGLASVLPVDYIQETIDHHLQILGSVAEVHEELPEAGNA
jgi:S1-C subfamily serine protease